MSLLSRANHVLKVAWYRSYSNFLMPTRLDAYYDLLQNALDHGYKAHSILSFWQLLRNGGLAPTVKYLILRHDIDNTDVPTTRRFWEIERRLGLTSTYYFRLSTLALSLMKDMHLSGFEVSYHYEELATVAKEKGLTRPEQIDCALPYMRLRFKQNLFSLRQSTGLSMVTVAAHGDFVNRKLGIPSTIILKDEAFRKELSIECEAYDEILMRHVSTWHSEKGYPHFWGSEDPVNAIQRGESVVHVLTHPRQWHADPKLNLLDDMDRLWQGFHYYVAAKRHSFPLAR